MPKKDGENGKDGDDLDLSKNPVIIELGKAIKGLGALVTQQSAASVKTNENLTALVESIKSGDLGGGKKKEPDGEPDPDALDDLTNSQIIPLVLGEVGKLLDEKLKTLDTKIGQTDQGIADDKIEKEFKALVLTNPDLFEWSGEIAELNKTTPGLSIKQLYTLARDSNPDKVAEMTEKFKKEKEGKDGEDDEGDPGLIGFMPTSGVTAEGDEKLTKEEAANKAWEDTLEEFPALAQLGEG